MKDPIKRLLTAITITLVLFLSVFIGGVVGNSLALRADSYHVLTDIGALLLALGANLLTRRRPSKRFSYGYGRISVLVAVINGSILFLIATDFLMRGVKILHTHPKEASPLIMLVLGFISIFANMVMMRVMKGIQDAGTKSAYWDMLSDVLAGIAISMGAIIQLMAHRMNMEWHQIDGVLTIGVSVLMYINAVFHILIPNIKVVLDAVPSGVNYQAVLRELNGCRYIKEVGHLRIRSLDGILLHAEITARTTVRGKIKGSKPV